MLRHLVRRDLECRTPKGQTPARARAESLIRVSRPVSGADLQSIFFCSWPLADLAVSAKVHFAPQPDVPPKTRLTQKRHQVEAKRRNIPPFLTVTRFTISRGRCDRFEMHQQMLIMLIISGFRLASIFDLNENDLRNFAYYLLGTYLGSFLTALFMARSLLPCVF